MSEVHAAAMLFAALLSDRGEGDAAFLAADVVVHRYGFEAERGACLEIFRGAEAVRRWASRTPVGSLFEAEPAVCPGSAGRVRYRLTAQGFVGGGSWRLELDDAGRIARLDHHPDDLDPGRQTDADWREAVELTVGGGSKGTP